MTKACQGHTSSRVSQVTTDECVRLNVRNLPTKNGQVCLVFPHETDAPCGALLSLSAALVCRDLCSAFSYPTKQFVFSQISKVLKHWCWPLFTHFKPTFNGTSFEVPRAVPVTVSVLWHTAPLRLVCMHQSFRGSSRLVLPWMCRQQVPQKRWYLCTYTSLHGDMSYKTGIFVDICFVSDVNINSYWNRIVAWWILYYIPNTKHVSSVVVVINWGSNKQLCFSGNLPFRDGKTSFWEC